MPFHTNEVRDKLYVILGEGDIGIACNRDLQPGEPGMIRFGLLEKGEPGRDCRAEAEANPPTLEPCDLVFTSLLAVDTFLDVINLMRARMVEANR